MKMYSLNCKVTPNRFEIDTSTIDDSIVKELVERFNNSNTTLHCSVIQNKTQEFPFRLVYHEQKDLFDNPDYLFAQALLQEKNREEKLTIIHLTWFNCFKKKPEGAKEKELLSGCGRYQKIMDSGIWNYYVPIFNTLEIDETNPSFNVERLHDVLLCIYDNTIRDLYKLAITHEFADLNARLLEQSRLKGGHKNISPFLFHSEKEMKGHIADYEDESKAVSLHTIRNYRWRFLLLDDKSIEKMSPSDKNSPQVDVCKLKIIANNLHHVLGFDENKIWFRIFEFEPAIRNKNDGSVLDKNGIAIEPEENGKPVELKIRCGRVVNGSFQTPEGLDKQLFMPKPDQGIPSALDDIQIVIDCVKYVDAAQYCLQKFKYEIILLDYLLDNDKVQKEQEFGYQLLEKLNDWNKKKKEIEKDGTDENNPILKTYIPGPNKRFFFMFTSAFTTAVHERLLAEGFAKSDRGLWYIGDGACPTNTPYLFSYQLLLLMRHRLADLMKELEGGCMSIIDLLELIYVKRGEAGTEETRQKAHEHFNHVLFMREKYKRLEKDLSKIDEEYLKKNTDDAEYVLMKMKSSLLIQSMLKMIHHFSGAFFEHLQHLVYLTAFGTIRQWQDMWEEYVFVNKELYDYDKFVEEEGTNEKRGKAISDAIREYIINLKENNY